MKLSQKCQKADVNCYNQDGDAEIYTLIISRSLTQPATIPVHAAAKRNTFLRRRVGNANPNEALTQLRQTDRGEMSEKMQKIPLQ